MTKDFKDINTYNKDGRASLFELYDKYEELELKYGFKKEIIYTIDIETAGGPVNAGVYCYKSALKGPALWILSGIHGEEPAGPNAISRNIDNLGELSKEIPLVIIPLLNPKGYSKDWRYFDEYRDYHKGHSISDSEHYLPDSKNPSQPRITSPSSEIAQKVTKFLLDTLTDYLPILICDHHEDKDLENSYLYVYSQISNVADDEVAKKVLSILEESGIPIQKDGVARFGERIKDGIVIDINGQPIKDGSIDELLGNARQIIVKGKIIQKPIARVSLVIETPIVNVSLKKRIQAHSNIIKQLRTLWVLANR